jgi:hypothetical protein
VNPLGICSDKWCSQAASESGLCFFHERKATGVFDPIKRICLGCGISIDKRLSSARSCSNACRQKVYRQRVRETIYEARRK